MRSPAIPLILFGISELFYPPVVSGRLSTDACYALDCLAISPSGTTCFVPAPRAILSTTCDGGPRGSPIFQHFVDIHIAQDESIAYYDLDGHILGGASWSIPIPVNRFTIRPVVLCMSGCALDGHDYTLCRFSRCDNDVGDPWAERVACVVRRPVPNKDDGCFVRMPSTLLASRSAASTLVRAEYNSGGDTSASTMPTASVSNTSLTTSTGGDAKSLAKATSYVIAGVLAFAAFVGMVLCALRRRSGGPRSGWQAGLQLLPLIVQPPLTPPAYTPGAPPPAYMPPASDTVRTVGSQAAR